MINGKRVMVVLPAYNAAQTLEKTLREVPPGVVDDYLLVDDVFTTGFTLNSCALALRRSGGLNLDVVTFGHG